MIRLTATTDLLRVVTSDAAAYSVAVYASWSDVPLRRSVAAWPPPGTVSSGRYNNVIIAAATTTIVTAPAATAQRGVELVSIRNTHMSIAVTVAVQHTDGTTAVTLWSGELAAGESVVCAPDGVWTRYSVDGVRSGSGLTDLELRASAVPVAIGAAIPAGTNNIGDVDVLTVPAPLSTTGNGTAATALRVTMASDSTGTVIATAPTLTKGTQGATGYSVQDLKDAGRVLKTYTASALACVTAEALISLTPYADLVAGGAATTHAVTSGKRLRIQTIMVTVRATSTALVGGIIRLRMLAGTVLVGSPVHATLGACASEIAATIAGQSRGFMINFPDGLELSGTMQFGLTQLFSAVTATIDVQVVGYEY